MAERARRASTLALAALLVAGLGGLARAQAPEGGGAASSEAALGTGAAASAADAAARGPKEGAAERAAGATPGERLAAANALYAEERYAEAGEAYAALIDEGYFHETLFYNLGCARAREGRLGEAVAHFRRALFYAPRHGDARANLALVRERLGVAPTFVESPREALARVAAMAPARGVLLVALLLELAGVALIGRALLSREGREGRARRALPAGVALLIAALVVAAPALVTIGLRASERGATVVVERGEVRSGPGPANPVLFAAPEGLEVEVLEARADHARVRAAGGGASGWIACSALLGVDPARALCGPDFPAETP